MPISQRLIGGAHSGRTVLIVEPNVSGHRLYYVALLVRNCASAGDRVVIATSPGASTADEWKVHLSDIVHGSVTVITTRKFELEAIAQLAHNVRSSITVIPDGDRHVLQVLKRGWHGHGDLSLLAMRPDAQPTGSAARMLITGHAKKLLIMAADRRRKTQVSALRSPLVNRTWPISWVADPVAVINDDDARKSVRKKLSSGAGLYWVGVVGSITPRKNLDIVARAVLATPGAGLAIAGSVEASVERDNAVLLNALRDSGRLVRWPGTVGDAEFDAIIHEVDCIVAAHSNEGPSGIVGKAAIVGTPLVLAGASSLRKDARSLHGRARWCSLNERGIAAGILASQGSRHAPLDLNAGVELFVRKLT